MIFSIIIPCYNSENTIVRALKSVVEQTFLSFEVIIVDDGSIDNTKKVIERYLYDKDIYYKYIYQKNQGASVARNNAVRHAQGNYLAFLDSDDEWDSNKLQIQYDFLKKLSCKFISCKFTLDQYSSSFKDINVKKYFFKDFLISNRTSTPCTVIEKRLFDEIGGFDEKLRYSEDYNLWLKVSLKEPLYFLNLSLVKLYKKPYGESGLSSHLWEMEKGELNNYTYLYKHGNITIITYVSIVCFSLVKFMKRSLFK